MDVATTDESVDESLLRIVAGIAAGDRAAEAELVQRFQAGITLLARRHARPNESRVADVTQNVFATVIERLRSGALRDAMALPAYLRTCVVREVAGLYRGPELQSAETLREETIVPGVQETPEVHVGREQDLANVARALDALPVARDRELLIRFYVHEQSRDEICAVLGIDESHFRRVLFRARSRLLGAIGSVT